MSYFPTFAKGKITVPEVPSASKKIQDTYHEAMEAGRFMEKSIGDAIYEIKKFKKDLEEKVKACLRDIITNINGCLPTLPRAKMYIANVIKFIKEMKEFLDEIAGVIKAVIAMINLLVMILKQIIAAIQSIVNALANLLAEICNWNLPKLPSLPSLKGLLHFDFPGFNLMGALAGFKSIKFDIKFTFPKCSIKLPTFRDAMQNNTGSIKLGDLGFNNYLIPTREGLIDINGNIISLPINIALGGPLITANQANDKDFKGKYLTPSSTTPFYLDTFNPNTEITKSLPNASSIQNAFYLPPKVYQANMASLISGLSDAALPYGTGNPSYPDGEKNIGASGPDGSSGIDTVTSSTIQSFKLLLKDHVRLERVYDTEDAHITSAWVKYLAQSRNSRQGKWVPEYEAAFAEHVKPSSEFLDTNDIPYNKIASVPDLPLLKTIKSLPEVELWKLSYVEASLLGYDRTTRWDSAADTTWFSYVQGALDYTTTPLTDRTIEQTLDSGGLAVYPVSVKVSPSWIEQFQIAVQHGAADIQNAPDWRTQQPQFRYIYDQYGLATEVDRYSQFWREWAHNFESLMSTEDSIALPYILEYWQTINSRVNPLANSSLYDYLKYDSIHRKAKWAPGDDVINIPTSLDQGMDIGYEPDDLSSGWTVKSTSGTGSSGTGGTSGTGTGTTNGGTGTGGTDLNDVVGTTDTATFDPTIFLQRPDIRALPITHQQAMLDLNLAYASVLASAADQQFAINKQIDSLNALISTSLVKGFRVNSTQDKIIKPKIKTLLSFNETEFDIVNNIATPTTFIIQDDGVYNFNGQYEFSATTKPVIRYIEMWVNGKAVTIDQSDSVMDAVTVTTTHQLNLKRKDKVQIKAYGSLDQTENMTLKAGYSLSSIATASDTITSIMNQGRIIQSGGNAVYDLTNATPGTLTGADKTGIAGQYVWGTSGAGQKVSPAGTSLASLMAVFTNSDGKVLPIHPELDSPQIPFFDGITLNGGNPNDTVVVAMAYGMEYQITISVPYR